MNIKSNNDGIIGNGKILAGYTNHGELIRMTYPSIDYKQSINFFHVGVKINDSAIIYLHDDINNYYNQKYIEKTNILETKVTNSYFNLEVKQTDFALLKKDLIIKEYVLKNNNSIDLNINFLIHSEFSSSPEDMISARVVNNALLQYNYNYTFAIFSNKEISSKQIHNSKDTINSGMIYGKDYIGMSNDSSISYELGNFKPGEEKRISIFIYAKENNEDNNFEDIIYEIDKIKKTDILKELENVKKYWKKYVENHYKLEVKEIDKKIRDIYIRSILLFPLITNKKTGGIIAGLEGDEYKQRSGGYGYCWTRDAVFITKALDLLGMHNEVEKFYNNFCKKTQSKNGMWEQRFYTNEKLAPCWGYQIDETASVVYGIYEHYKFTNDVKFINNNLKMCEKAINFLLKYLKNIFNEDEQDIVKQEIIKKCNNKNDEYKQLSYDLWEMNEGIHLYSLSSIYAAFDAMLCIYELSNDESTNNRLKIEKLQNAKKEIIEYKEKIKEFIEKNLYNYNQNILLRNCNDERADISILGATIPFNVFDVTDKAIENSVEKINMTLRTYTGGYLRFQDDHYMGGNNPWPIATLWMAIYYSKIGDKNKFLECINFVVNSSTDHGFLAEQVDNESLKSNWMIGLGWSHAMFIIALNSIKQDREEDLYV